MGREHVSIAERTVSTSAETQSKGEGWARRLMWGSENMMLEKTGGNVVCPGFES